MSGEDNRDFRTNGSFQCVNRPGGGNLTELYYKNYRCGTLTLVASGSRADCFRVKDVLNKTLFELLPNVNLDSRSGDEIGSRDPQDASPRV